MKVYIPYIITKDCSHEGDAMSLSSAYDEAVRLKSDYGAFEAGVKVCEQNCLRIISWKEGRYCYLKGAYLYKIPV